MAKRRKRHRQKKPAPPPISPVAAVAAPVAQRRRRRRDGLCLAAVVLVGLLVYGNSLRNGLVRDGRIMLTHGELPDPLDLRAIFLQPYSIGAATRSASGRDWVDRIDANSLRNRELGRREKGSGKGAFSYRPLTTWILAYTVRANEHLGREKADPRVFHLVNVILFGAVAGLVFVLARVLGAPRLAALSAAMLFATHPIHTEVVAGVVGVSELLTTLFGLLMLWAHREGARPWTCGALYLAALLSKESGAGFGAAAIVVDLLFRERGAWRARAWHWGTYVLVGLGWWFGMRASVLGGLGESDVGTGNVLLSAGAYTRILTALRVQLDYLLLQVAPFSLSVDYSFPQIRPSESLFDLRVLAFLLVFGVTVTLAWRWRRSQPRVALAVFAYAALFAPAANIVIAIGTIMAERLAFPSSVFFCLLAGEGYARARKRSPRLAAAAAVLILSVFTLATVRRNHVWSDQDAFIQAMAEDAPQSLNAQLTEARRLFAAGDYEGALGRFERAEALIPGARCDYMIGRCLDSLGRTQEATPRYRSFLGRKGDLRLRPLSEPAELMLERTVRMRLAELTGEPPPGPNKARKSNPPSDPRAGPSPVGPPPPSSNEKGAPPRD